MKKYRISITCARDRGKRNCRNLFGKTAAASVVVLLFVFSFIAFTGCSTTTAEPGKYSAPLTVDPGVTVNRLANGLTYYVRHNARPENRVDLRLVIRAGSVNEDDDQRGIAHFVEHMAFNTTKNFKKQEVVDFLESIGMRFGPELNAYTNFDETVYIIQVPTENKADIEKAVRILYDWAQNVLFLDEEMDTERKIIIEEWRLGRGAQERMRDLQIPVLFKGSRYAERRPIGKIETLEKADSALLKRFYGDWYRPERMAIVAVGDVDPGWMSATISSVFSGAEAKGQARKAPDTRIPDHEDTLVSIATDKEATASSAILYIKHDPESSATEGDYRSGIIRYLYDGILNARFDEYARDPSSPIISGFSSYSRYVAASDYYYLGAETKQGEIAAGLETVLTEVERIKRFGVTQAELDREKASLLSWMENAYNERDKTDTSSYVREYVANFLDDEYIPGIAKELEMYKAFLPGITLDEVNEQASLLLTPDNRVILVQAPDSKDFKVPDEKTLASIVEKVAAKQISQYVENVSDEPLVSEPLGEKAIVSEKTVAEIGVTDLRLENGVRVILKPTDFKKGEIVFTAFSPGGTSLAQDKDYIAASSASDIIDASGVGKFSATELGKKLAGKSVSVSPWTNEVLDGMRGSSVSSDIETCMSLIYLYFTSPRKDESAFLTIKERIRNELANKESSPESVFWDVVQSAITNDHFRSRPWTLSMLDEMNLDKSYSFYLDRYSDASDFTFVFVGSFTVEEMKPLLKKYIGNLPSENRKEMWKDSLSFPPSSPVEKVVEKGIAPKSLVEIVYLDKTEWSFESRFRLSLLANILDIELRDKVREEAGGTYDISAASEMYHYPHGGYNVYIGFGCAPDQVEKLTSLVYSVIDSVKTKGPLDANVAKVKEMFARGLETSLKQNNYWMSELQYRYLHGVDPAGILRYGDMISAITKETLGDTAKKYLDSGHKVRVVLYPENHENAK